jgi:type III secretory pathway component EscU
MARTKIKMDHRGIESLLKSSQIADAVSEATEAVADNARAQSIDVEGIPGDIALPVTTQMVTTDRAHGIVAIAHPSGEAVQAKHGTLTKAAAEAGLEVRGA